MTHTISPRSLYIHWPFCKYKCHFCDFVAFEGHNHFMEEYHRALCHELTVYAHTHGTNTPIETIFFGGGTPSTYPLDLLEELFATLHKRYTLSDNPEISIEVNPGDVGEHELFTWKQLGINRLSIGVQVLDDDVLHRLNRRQHARDAHALIADATACFDNISVDLIVGLPGVTDKSWWHTLTTVTSWPLSHISLYLLMVHENTPLYFNLKRGLASVLSDDDMADRYFSSSTYLTTRGFERYEISNFTRPGYQCAHNQTYWNRLPYQGFGIGSASFDGHVRYRNTKNLTSYLKRYNPTSTTTTLWYEFEETLDTKQIRLEQLMLGLRQQNGVDLRTVLYSTNTNTSQQMDSMRNTIVDLKRNDLIREEGGRLILTDKGMVVENEVILALL